MTMAPRSSFDRGVRQTCKVYSGEVTDTRWNGLRSRGKFDGGLDQIGKSHLNARTRVRYPIEESGCDDGRLATGITSIPYRRV